MLEKLTDIDWNKIQGRNGNAKEIPAAINQLRFGDKKAQIEASYTLEEIAVNQGTLYEAAYYLIPFLQEALQISDPEVKNLVYGLLYEISSRSAFDGGRKVDVDGKEQPLKKACRLRVMEGRSFYYSDLANDDPWVRYHVFELLVTFVECFEDIHQEAVQLIRSKTYVQYCEPQKLMLALELRLFPDKD